MLPVGHVRLLAALVGLFLVACSNAPSVNPQPTSLAADQTLRFPIQHDIATLDPAMLDSGADAEIAHNLFDGLLRFDVNLNVVPDIAATMPAISPDGMTYTFKLRDDVTFSNGDKVTSKDVLYSWNRAAAVQGPNASNLSAIVGYEHVAANQATGAALEGLLERNDSSVTMTGLSAPNESTVVVKLTTAAGWFESAIAQPAVAGMLVDQRVVKGDVEGWWGKPETFAGTGAYKLSARAAGKSLDFVALPDWWGRPRPTLTRVHLDVVSDPQTALTIYERGGFDLFGYAEYSPAPNDVVRIQATPAEKRQLSLQVRNKTYFVTFNMVADARRPAGGPFTLDLGKASNDMRLAFATSVDRVKLAKDICSDVTCVAATGGVIPKGLLGYLGDNYDQLSQFDPVRARSLLLAGDPTGSKSKGLVYMYDPENPYNEPVARFLKTQWHENLGVTVQLQTVPRTRFITERLRGTYVLSRDGWAAEYNHPQDWFDNLWGTVAGCPDAGCSSGYQTIAYDRLLARADAEPLDDAIPDYKALSRQLISDVAYVPLFYTVNAYLFKPHVIGTGANNLFDFYWNQIQLISH
ncbi:MAG TPA: peptide ABC transporter substrate-binding protein [Candidatus Dormibacteraeota bacterium]|nr:peptide ABC transporter substrate-binding protein [Candidatus Dormibacteraeota bacterium]